MLAITVLIISCIEVISSLSLRFIWMSLSLLMFLILIGIKLLIYLFSCSADSFGWLCNWFDGFVHVFTAALTYDTVSLVTTVVIFGVSSTILLFSVSYMLGDPRLYEFLLLLMLFVSCMVSIITATSLFWLITYWEGIGICSFGLISFWCMRVQAIRASLQAMLVNKIGDAFMVVGAIGLISCFYGDDTLLFTLSYDLLHWTFMLLLVGSMSKSALGLLHYWLPYAMEGPTSVSALIHAATLVTAGLFLILRTKYLLLSGYVTILLLVLGSVGILLLALIAIDQFDIKRLVAYSTLSQICYMLVVIVIGSPEIGLLYLLVHALFKSLMFMSCGGLIHGYYDQQDLRSFGGLSKVQPLSCILVLDTCLAMLGVIGTIGCYSKELIIECFGNTFSVHCWTIATVMMFGLLATTLYSAYMFVRSFMNSSNYSYPRSADDVGLFVALILTVQVLALLITGDYLSQAVRLSANSSFGNIEYSVVSAGSMLWSDYGFASLVLLSACLVKWYLGSIVALRIHSLKYLYDRSLNTVLVWLHEKSLLVRSDYIRSLFYVRWVGDSMSAVFRISYVHILIFLPLLFLLL